MSSHILYTPRSPGSVTAADFTLASSPEPKRTPGQVVVRPAYLSIDPYMVRMLKGQGSYFKRVEPGQPMRGRVVGRVTASDSAQYCVGTMVLGEGDWADIASIDPATIYTIDESSGLPLSAYLGTVGHSGITAWAGLMKIGKPKAGETVVVSAASGAVGSVVGQLARIHGCRAVGIAGGPGKVRHVVRDLGFDACVDYKSPTFADQLAEALPTGADIYFENVGGAVFDAVLPHLNRYARIPLCGMVSQYAGNAQPLTLRHFGALLDKTVLLQGFRVYDFLQQRDEILGRLAELMRSGQLRDSETIAEGLASAPQALADMMAGRNVGKQLVKL